MEEKEGLIVEYKALREEIKNNSQVIANIFTVTITGMAVLTGYGFKEKNWVIFLCSFVMLIPALWFIASQLESTVRIATYIRTCIEPYVDGLRWENKLSQLRKSNLVPERKYTLSITGIYGAIGITCILLSWIFFPWGGKGYSIIELVILIIASVVLVATMVQVILNVSKCFGQDFGSKYCKAWRELKE
ncbi:MAG: hypothetical protein MUP17_07255 [candidate division Zixibacteria bacterium]|nr:hypothetical protein [candidate division Zixibacteria bacterium]